MYWNNSEYTNTINIASLFVTYAASPAYLKNTGHNLRLQAHLYKLNVTLKSRDRHVTPAKYLPSGTASRAVCNLPVTQCWQPTRAKHFHQLHSSSLGLLRQFYAKMSQIPEQKNNHHRTICSQSRPEVWKWCIGCCCSTMQHQDSQNDISKQYADSHVAHTASQQYTPWIFRSENPPKITNPLNKRACMADSRAQPSDCSRDAHLLQSRQPGLPRS